LTFLVCFVKTLRFVKTGEDRIVKKPWIVAVDGPAGSGKSSICSRVATILNWTYVNTGAIYRAVGYLMQKQGVPEDDQKILAFLEEITPHISWVPETKKLNYRNSDITSELYSAEASHGASVVAKMPIVREKLLPLQRQMTLKSPLGALVDGRDIGTVVFPDAHLKIFMSASLEERAKRRFHQITTTAEKTGEAVTTTLEEVQADIANRDERDAGRGSAPLKKADDAVEFDNSGLTIDEAVNQLVQLVKSRLQLD